MSTYETSRRQSEFLHKLARLMEEYGVTIRANPHHNCDADLEISTDGDEWLHGVDLGWRLDAAGCREAAELSLEYARSLI
jgi:hypothetical protein